MSDTDVELNYQLDGLYIHCPALAIDMVLSPGELLLTKDVDSLFRILMLLTHGSN